MNDQEKLTDLLTELKDEQNYSLWLYFVVRKLKEGNKVTDKVLDKYDFVLKKIDLSIEIKKYFKDVLQDQISQTLLKPDIEMMEYQVIGDDLQNRIYTYALNNALSFSDIIINQLKNFTLIDPIGSLSEIKDDLWAYCIKISFRNKVLFSFRKSSSGKIATDEPQNLKEHITSWFDSKDSELKPVKGDLINFDNKIDCIYFNDKFYVFKKGSFEKMVGLEEEFLENATNVINVLHATELIEGIDILQEEITKSRQLLYTLSSISKKGNHNSFNADEIKKMKQVINRFEGKELKVNQSGKILLENNTDIKVFVKLLNDYYKQGLISGKYYGTNSGEVITESPS